MGGSIEARVGHSPDNSALFLEILSFMDVVLPQVDLKIPEKEEVCVSPAAPGLQVRL